MTDIEASDGTAMLSGPVRTWFAGAFPEGPTPAQERAWPPIAARDHVLLVSPTGTGKTLAGFLAILDRLFRAHAAGTLERSGKPSGSRSARYGSECGPATRRPTPAASSATSPPTS
jgi:hypothetical protein